MGAKVAFGTGVERFLPVGFHPMLDKNGIVIKKSYKLGPGEYDAHNVPCTFKTKRTIPMWKRQTDSEEYSKNMGFRNAAILERRDFMAKHLGPGSHEINEPAHYISPCNDQNFGRVKKFRQWENKIPGPGTYIIKSPKCFFRQTESNLDRSPRFKVLPKPWCLAPDRYHPEMYGSIDALLTKVVSLRGPYDLFTGSRDPTNSFNKLSPSKQQSPDVFYLWQTDVDILLHDSRKKNCGKFFKAKRFTIPGAKHRETPGPATYTLKMGIEKLPDSLYAFGSGVADAKPGVRWKIQPGPGRYKPRYGPGKCGHTKGGTCVFKSKTIRAQQVNADYNSF